MRGAGIPLHEATTGVIEAASPVRTPSGVVAIARWTLSPLATLWAPAPALRAWAGGRAGPGKCRRGHSVCRWPGRDRGRRDRRHRRPGIAQDDARRDGKFVSSAVARASLGETMRAARAAGLKVAATSAPASASTDLHAADLTGPLLVLLGNEGRVCLRRRCARRMFNSASLCGPASIPSMSQSRPR